MRGAADSPWFCPIFTSSLFAFTLVIQASLPGKSANSGCALEAPRAQAVSNKAADFHALAGAIEFVWELKKRKGNHDPRLSLRRAHGEPAFMLPGSIQSPAQTYADAPISIVAGLAPFNPDSEIQSREKNGGLMVGPDSAVETMSCR